MLWKNARCCGKSMEANKMITKAKPKEKKTFHVYTQMCRQKSDLHSYRWWETSFSFPLTYFFKFWKVNTLLLVQAKRYLLFWFVSQRSLRGICLVRGELTGASRRGCTSGGQDEKAIPTSPQGLAAQWLSRCTCGTRGEGPTSDRPRHFPITIGTRAPEHTGYVRHKIKKTARLITIHSSVEPHTTRKPGMPQLSGPSLLPRCAVDG